MGQLAPKTVFQWECDSCGKKRDAPEGLVPKGFSGDVMPIKSDAAQVDDDLFKTWYACSKRCIGPAVQKVLGVYVERGEDESPDDPEADTTDPLIPE